MPTTGRWTDRVQFAGGADGFAYRPNEVIVAGEAARDRALQVNGMVVDVEPVFPDPTMAPGGPVNPLFRLRGEVDPLNTVEDLRSEGFLVQPNHVVFAHSDYCCCHPHPADRGGVAGSPVYASPVYASPVYASPVYASPVYASPVYASPVYASPVYASPVYASQYRASGQRHSSARPANAPATRPPQATASTALGPTIVVLDTGLADPALRPAAVAAVHCARGHSDEPDEDGDHELDPAAGHGTFIAGIIDMLAPGCDISVVRVLSTFGDGDEVDIARSISSLSADVNFINLSFGGYTTERMHTLAAAIRQAQRRGTVVVASAGNDGTCRPTYPAALPGVVSVGAIGPDGPARFSNYGPWIRACAPGVDLTSAFFTNFNGPARPQAGAVDPDQYHSWATWSGTSFAAPVVVAALAREMRISGVSAEDAVKLVIDAPGLFRVPDLGTVVNLQ